MSSENWVIERMRSDVHAADELRDRARQLLTGAVRAGHAAGYSQRQIGDAIGRSQPEVSRLLRFHGKSALSQQITLHRAEIMRALREAGVENPRVFGSVARGEDHETSDVDLLVDIPDEMGLFAISRLEHTLSEIIGAPVDVTTARSLRTHLQDRVQAEAVPL